MGNYSMGSGCRAAQNYATRTTFIVFWTSPTFLSQIWKSSQLTSDTWRNACASEGGLSTLCQVSDQAAADLHSRRHQQHNPTATGPRCPQCSRVCASEFGLRSYLRSHTSCPSQHSYQHKRHRRRRQTTTSKQASPYSLLLAKYWHAYCWTA